MNIRTKGLRLGGITFLIILTAAILGTVLGLLLGLNNSKSSSYIHISACIDSTDLEEEESYSNDTLFNSTQTSDTNNNNNNNCIKSVNASVYLNYKLVGYTDTNGFFSISTELNPTDNLTLHIIDRVNGYGYSQIMQPLLQESSSTSTIQLYLISDYIEPLFINLNGIDKKNLFFYPISYNWSEFDVYFYYENKIASYESIHEIRSIQLYSSLFPENIFELKTLFQLNSDKTVLSIANSSQLASLVNSMPKHGAIEFMFYVDLNLGDDSIYLETFSIDFYLTQFKINGTVHLSSSYSSSPFDDASITQFKLKSLTNPTLTFNIDVNKTGEFLTNQLPIGTYYFEASAFITNQYFKANGNILLSNNLFLNVTLLSLNESLSSNASSFNTVNSLLRKKRLFEFDQVPRIQNNTTSNQLKEPSLKVRSSSNQIGVSVLSGVQNTVVTDVKQINIISNSNSKPKSVRLSYQVTSKEYPYYVQKQSIFNDVWSLSVYTSDGQILFFINKDVNSMLYQNIDGPHWISASIGTGTISVDIDLQGIDTSSLYLKAISVNIGDSILPTSVAATLSVNDDLLITSIKFINFVKCKEKTEKIIPNPCWKTENSLSIPPINEKNKVQKYVNVKYETNQQVKISQVDVYFSPINTNVPIQTLSSPIDNDKVKQIDNSNIQIRVSFSDSNTISFSRFNRFKFKIVFTYTINDEQVSKTVEKLSDIIVTALWQAPFYYVASKRYSTRETGGDGWSSVSMYNWIEQNSATGLWSRYNDVSGEHTQNLGHASHELGNHIDIFHYYTIDSSSGTNNFNAFVKAILENKVNTIKDWILAHRSKFDLLNADSNVVQIINHGGKKDWNGNSKFEKEWLKKLFQTGKLTSFDIDLKLSEWKSPAKMNWRPDHTHHIHIQIKN
jgi:hypothetical protein